MRRYVPISIGTAAVPGDPSGRDRPTEGREVTGARLQV